MSYFTESPYFRVVATTSNRWKIILHVLTRWVPERENLNPHKALKSYYMEKVYPLVRGTKGNELVLEEEKKAARVEDRNQFLNDIEKFLADGSQVFDLYKNNPKLKFEELEKLHRIISNREMPLLNDLMDIVRRIEKNSDQ